MTALWIGLIVIGYLAATLVTGIAAAALFTEWSERGYLHQSQRRWPWLVSGLACALVCLCLVAFVVGSTVTAEPR